MGIEFSIEWEIPEETEGAGIDQSDDAQILFRVTATNLSEGYYAKGVQLHVILQDPNIDLDDSRKPTEHPNDRIGIFREAVDPNDKKWQKFVKEIADQAPSGEGFVVADEVVFPLGDFKETNKPVTRAFILKTGRALLKGPAYSGKYEIPCFIKYEEIKTTVTCTPGEASVRPLAFTVQPD